MMMNDQLIFEEEFDETHEYTEEEIKEYALTIDIDPEKVTTSVRLLAFPSVRVSVYRLSVRTPRLCWAFFSFTVVC